MAFICSNVDPLLNARAVFIQALIPSSCYNIAVIFKDLAFDKVNKAALEALFTTISDLISLLEITF